MEGAVHVDTMKKQECSDEGMKTAEMVGRQSVRDCSSPFRPGIFAVFE